MQRTRWVAVSAVAVGALLVGGGTAFADTPSPTPAPAPAAGSNAKVCTVRIPALLAKIDKLTTKINADATTKGSTAWLQAREDRARSAGRTALADLIQVRVTNRAQRLTELAHVKDQVEKVKSTDCGS